MDQVRQHDPPPNSAKEEDTRFAATEAFATLECWELDALSPAVIADLIRTEIEALIDWPAWEAAQAEEGRGRTLLADAAENWAKVENLLRRAS